jgi:hypothetical protein
MTWDPAIAPIVLRPHVEPLNFIDKWSHPVWKRCGVYLWSIDYRGAFLVSYVGKTFGSSTNFEKRIWREYKRWRQGNEDPVDIEAYIAGRRHELSSPSGGHLQRELSELLPILRLWLMPLDNSAECHQAERWIVAQLCQDAVSRQFLVNRKPHTYRPDPRWPVRIEATPAFRIVGLTIASSVL